MRRKRARGTGYLGTDKGLRELYPRLGLHEKERSTSDEPHNRRKPRVGSTGTPELASNLSGINAKIPNQEFTKDKVAGAGQWTKSEVSGTGQWAKGELPGDIHYGRVNLGGDTQGTLDAANVGGNGKIAQKNLDLPPIAAPGDLNALEQRLKKFMAKHYQKRN